MTRGSLCSLTGSFSGCVGFVVEAVWTDVSFLEACEDPVFDGGLRALASWVAMELMVSVMSTFDFLIWGFSSLIALAMSSGVTTESFTWLTDPSFLALVFGERVDLLTTDADFCGLGAGVSRGVCEVAHDGVGFDVCADLLGGSASGVLG